MMIAVSLLIAFVLVARINASLEDLTPPPQNFKQWILNAHNQYRAQLRNGPVGDQPQARTMPDLIWNEDLVRSAQQHADACVPRHDTYAQRATRGFDYVGQNLYAGPTVQDAVELWWIEYKWYNYQSMTCQPGKICGHYTQLVWAESTQVGCVFKNCDSSTFPYGYIVICNYGEAGNFAGEHPYVAA